MYKVTRVFKAKHTTWKSSGADLGGVIRVISHPPPWRGSLFHVIGMHVT